VRYLARLMPNVADLGLPPSPNGKEVLVPAKRAVWRQWLGQNADRPDGLWVVYRNKSSHLEGPLYDELVEEALCFGWIDSVTRRLDDDRLIQWFSPRRKGGVWSALNKERVDRLIEAGLMSDRGLHVIEEAKSDGSWSQYDDVEALIVPADLEGALLGTPGAAAAYEALSVSARKQLLWQVYSAKRPQTRAARIERLVTDLVAGETDV
jgi:uncharacterized protein YdeI (YjbR/CyaY-like superfamily)